MTPEIRLRPLRTDDAPAHLAGCDDLIVQRLSGGRVATLEQTREWLARNGRAWRDHGPVVDLGIEDAATGVLVGVVGIQRGLDYLRPGQVNLSYAVYAPSRRRGYATAACACAMRLAREREPVTEFVIRTSTDNPESAAVARRLGFAFDRTSDDGHGVLDWWVHL